MPQDSSQRLWIRFQRLVALCLIMVSAACTTPTISPSIRTPEATLAVQVTRTPTPAPPTETPLPPTQAPTPTQTSTPRPTPTLVPSDTPTETPPELAISQRAACFAGQGTSFPLVATLNPGDSVVVQGKNEALNWYWVQLGEGGTNCWVSAVVGEFQGDPSPLPVFTAAPTPIILPTSTPDQKALKFYLIALGTGGPFGCGDGLVYFYSNTRRKESTEDNVKAALNALFDVKSEYLGNYYNPVYKSNLNVTSVTFDQSTGQAKVYLSGTFVKPKDECDSKRIHAQVWETVYQFEGIKRVDIWVKDKLLGDLLEMAP